MISFFTTFWKPILVLLIVAGLVGGGIYASGVWYDRGVQHQQLLDKAASATAAANDERKIEAASHANDQELLALRNYRDTHPALRVCVSPRAVPAAPAVAGRTGKAGPAPADIQPVPAANTGSGLSDADRGALLAALAAAADATSAQLRGVQGAR